MNYNAIAGVTNTGFKIRVSLRAIRLGKEHERNKS